MEREFLVRRVNQERKMEWDRFDNACRDLKYLFLDEGSGKSWIKFLFEGIGFWVSLLIWLFLILLLSL
jgi:hypothetical protein